MGLEILTMLLSFFGGAGGSWITKAMGIWEQKTTQTHELELLRMQQNHEKLMAELGQTGEMAERESEREIAAMSADERSLVASYEHDTSMTITNATEKPAMWAEIYKTVTRPSLSHLVLAVIAAIYFTTENEVIRATITDGMLASFAIIIGWWFGDRAKRVADVMFGPGYIRRTRGVEGDKVNANTRSSDGAAALDGLRNAES